MSRRVIVTFLLICTGLTGMPAAAGALYPDAGTPTRLFVSLDDNADGYLDADELAGAPAWLQLTLRSDRNQDARLDHVEFLSLLDSLDARR